MDYLFDYLLFLAQAVTVVVAILMVMSAIASLSMKRQHAEGGHLEVKKLNERLQHLKDGVRQAVLHPSQFKKVHKQDAKANKKEAKEQKKADRKSADRKSAEESGADRKSAEESGADRKSAEESGADRKSAEESGADTKSAEKSGVDNRPAEDGSSDGKPPAERSAVGPGRPRLFVLEFEGDIQASKVGHLRTEITAVLTMAEASDEVLVRIESPGGAVHGYGLAASQLDRIRQHGIPLVVAVDKVAASGGYLMAAVADRIVAAPFAVLGSIGVIAQIPNVHRLLKKHDVDVELLTAGKYKRTLTVLGENTDEGRQKFVEELEDVHELFQEFVSARRPKLDMDEVATGEVWYGERALGKRLIDELMTSDEYLTKACEDRDVFEVRWVEHRKPIERLMAHAEGALTRIVGRLTDITHR